MVKIIQPEQKILSSISHMTFVGFQLGHLSMILSAPCLKLSEDPFFLLLLIFLFAFQPAGHPIRVYLCALISLCAMPNLNPNWSTVSHWWL